MNERWARADLHLHTTCSDGMHTPEELASWLARSPLAVAAVTDHDTVEGGLRVREALRGRPGPEIVTGCEVSSRDGHVLALFISRDVPAGMSAEATIAAIHERGGLAVAAHPYSLALGVGDLAARLPFDGIELLNGSPFMEMSNGRAARRLGTSGRALVGGSDAHVAWAAGAMYTRFPGESAAELRAALEARQVRPAVDWPRHLAAMPAHVAWLGWLLARRGVRAAPTAAPEA